MTMTTFQQEVGAWVKACLGEAELQNVGERNHRFLEEALELVQASGATAEEAHQLVDYVFRRPVGEVEQEVGGVMLTLAALCQAHGLGMHACGSKELRRVWTRMVEIRAKHMAKPRRFSKLWRVPSGAMPKSCVGIASALEFVLSFVRWAQGLPGDPTVQQIQQHFDVSRATAYRWRGAWLAVFGQHTKA